MIQILKDIPNTECLIPLKLVHLFSIILESSKVIIFFSSIVKIVLF
jgi:hypothetical protein